MMNEQEKVTGSRKRWLVITLVSAVLLALLIIGLSAYAGGIHAVGRPLVEALPDSLADRLFPQKAPKGAWPASGVIQADEVALASELGGRVARVYVADGRQVARGEVLLQLDTGLVEAKIKAAEAAVALAEAAVVQARAGARPGQIAIAGAQLEQALAAQAAATQAVSDTLSLVEKPQELLLQIGVTRAQIEAAGHEVAQAVALKDAAEVAKNKFEDVNEKWGGIDRYRAHISGGSLDLLPDEFQELLPEWPGGSYNIGDYELEIGGGSYDLYKWVDISIPLGLHQTPNQWWQAWVGVNAATAYQEGLQASLGQLYRQVNRPLSLQAQADQAAAALVQSEAQVAAAQAQVDGLKAGASAEFIAALEARRDQAQAGLDTLLAERKLLTISAPQGGLVLALLARPGEVVAPGAALLTLADLEELRLTVYVPEDRLGLVWPDQAVEVTVDGYPEQPFSGRVLRIADQAQFTPRNITTADERVNLVFAVDIALTNPGGRLKPGMAAEVVFLES